jgi:hypothetical protein
MNIKTILAASLLIIIAGCKKERSDERLLPDGHYAGTYRITGLGPGPWPVVSHVVLSLQDGKFEGDSDNSYHPTICKGSYTRTDHTITFQTDCILPAVASLQTLDKTWDIVTEGDSLTLTAQNLIETKPQLTIKRLN